MTPSEMETLARRWELENSAKPVDRSRSAAASRNRSGDEPVVCRLEKL